MIDMMELSEAHVWPLKSTTNCYAGGKRRRTTETSSSLEHQQQHEESTGSAKEHSNELMCHYQIPLATEHDVICLDFPPRNRRPFLSVRSNVSSLNNDRGQGVTLNRKNDDLIHVGFSNSGPWEALALLSPGSCSSPESSSLPYHEKGEDSIQLSPDAISSLSDNPPPPSNNDNDSMNAKSPQTQSPQSQQSRKSVNIKQSIKQDSSSHISVREEQPPIESYLILRHCEDRQTLHSTSLRFRPLAVTLGEIYLVDPAGKSSVDDPGHDDGTKQEIKMVPVVWCGSADTFNLHCFTIDDDFQLQQKTTGTSSPSGLCSLSFPKGDDNAGSDAFQFTSPVMAIDHITYHNKNTGKIVSCLAVACQDGTVQVNTFTSVQRDGTTTNWKNLTTHSIVIDGPLVSIQLFNNEANGQLVALVGSLFGYVVKLTCSAIGPSETGVSWDAPEVVVDSLWNSHLMCEDMVLALYALVEEDLVIVGTHSGRCFVYQADGKSTLRSNDEETSEKHDDLKRPPYRCIWKCRLPYSIHGICAWRTKVDADTSSKLEQDGILNLVITTRRSAHLFQQCRPSQNTNCLGTPKPLLDAKLAKERIAKLCRLQVSH